jgi:uncharacterized protein YgiM (DUF1202 family)
VSRLTQEASVTNTRRSTRIAIACAVVCLVAGCAVPTATRTVAVPAPARSLDVLEVAVDAARAVGLPAVSKLDRTNGVVEFGAFETPSSEYAAQVRRRPDGGLDVTVKRGPGEGAGSVDDKARELVAALETRLGQGPASRSTPPPAPDTPSTPPPAPPTARPAAPAAPPAPSRQEPAPSQGTQPTVTVVVSATRANLRERGDPNSKLVRVVPRNTRLTVLGKANQWYFVRLDDGTEAWVAESVTSPVR